MVALSVLFVLIGPFWELTLLWQTLGGICGLGRGKPEDEVEIVPSQSAKVRIFEFWFLAFTSLDNILHDQMLDPIICGNLEEKKHKKKQFMLKHVHLCWIWLIFQNISVNTWTSHFIFTNIKIIWDLCWKFWSHHLFVHILKFHWHKLSRKQAPRRPHKCGGCPATCQGVFILSSYLIGSYNIWKTVS